MTVEEYNRSVDEYADNLYRFVLKNLKQDDMARILLKNYG